MTEADAFLAQICANPGDDTVRLVFADWLDEHGDDPVRAAIIRAGVARPDAGLFAVRYSLVSRKEVWVFGGGEGAWVPGLIARLREELPDPRDSSYFEVITYRRGFVDAVRLPWEEWAPRGDALRKVFPLSRVELTTEPMFDSVSLEYDDVGGTCTCEVAGQEITVPDSANATATHLAVCAARWGGVTFTSPASRR